MEAPPPAWGAPPPTSSSGRRLITMVALGALFAMIGGTGVYEVYQAANRPAPLSGASPAGPSSPAQAAPTQSPAPSPTPSPVGLTADLSGQYCPVAHRGDSACWRGMFVNTGPAIGKLALIFVTGGGYSNWFATHANWALLGFFTTPGCELDATHLEMICGSVPPGGQVMVNLGGDASAAGTFHYAVKFADIASGSPVYVDQHPDGTPGLVSWFEVIG